jgi:hypothetical protein
MVTKKRRDKPLSRRIEGELKGPQQQPRGLAAIISGIEGRAAPQPQSQTDHRWPEGQIFLRFADLKRMGIVFNYPHLRRLKALGFPVGKWLSANVRVWLPSEIAAWVASFPTERPVMPEHAKRREQKAAVAPQAKAGREALANPKRGRR